jgi:hypothetical protein
MPKRTHVFQGECDDYQRKGDSHRNNADRSHPLPMVHRSISPFTILVLVSDATVVVTDELIPHLIEGLIAT